MAEPGEDAGEAEGTPEDQPQDTAPNAADPAALKEQRRRARRSKDQAKDFWRRVFGDETGRREMWRLLDELHAFETKFACGPNGFPQPEATWFHAGEQAFGLRLYHSWLLLDHEGVRLMHLENDPRFQKPKRSRNIGES